MVDYPERQKAPNDAKNYDLGKRRMINAFAWPGGRCNRSKSEIVTK